MTGYDRTKPLISIHVPKCAGSSLREVLMSWFGAGFFRHYHNEREGEAPMVFPLWDEDGVPTHSEPVCVHGHFNRSRRNGFERYYPYAEQLITVLRDPCEVQISNYFYVKEAADRGTPGAMTNGTVHEIVSNQWTLSDWLGRHHGSIFLPFLPEGTDVTNYREVLDDRFLYIGLAEHMDRVVEDLSDLLGFEPIPVPKLNAAARDETVDRDLRERFAANHPMDVAIFEHLLERFDSKLTAH
ncbi:MAG: hypothetical protein AAGG11_01045 [Pseudomonadota bacterium]